jgi:hypothetical protein
MNKIIMLMALFIALSLRLSAQGEKVNWDSPAMYSAKEISVKTKKVELICKDCKYIEIKSVSGLTGIFITGKGTYSVPEKAISDNFFACMIRFNPSGKDNILKINGAKEYTDEQQLQASILQLRSVFKHCYHEGWNALIPGEKEYVVNFLGGAYKDLLVGDTKEKSIVYDFTKRKEY